MPYELSFSKPLEIGDPEVYFNECCHGGDLVSNQLRPMVEAHYDHLQANQEDWGWFLWFREGKVALAIDITCDDPVTGKFRIHLISRLRRVLWFWRVMDAPELDALKERVVQELTGWLGEAPAARHMESL